MGKLVRCASKGHIPGFGYHFTYWVGPNSCFLLHNICFMDICMSALCIFFHTGYLRTMRMNYDLHNRTSVIISRTQSCCRCVFWCKYHRKYNFFALYCEPTLIVIYGKISIPRDCKIEFSHERGIERGIHNRIVITVCVNIRQICHSHALKE